MVKIRTAKESDFDGIFKLYKQLFEFECAFDDNLNKKYYETEKAKQKVLKIIRNRKIFCLVALKNNEIVGLVDGYMLDDDFYLNKVAYLEHLCVDENYRRSGIGKLLIDSFRRKMKSKGAEYLKLNAFREDSSAISFCKKDNFKIYSIHYVKKT